MLRCIEACDLKRRAADVNGNGSNVGTVFEHRNCDRTAAGAEIGKACAYGEHFYRRAHRYFRVGTRDEARWRYFESKPVKFPFPEDIL